MRVQHNRYIPQARRKIAAGIQVTTFGFTETVTTEQLIKFLNEKPRISGVL